MNPENTTNDILNSPIGSTSNSAGLASTVPAVSEKKNFSVREAENGFTVEHYAAPWKTFVFVKMEDVIDYLKSVFVA